jgi:hypothetical protein
MELEVRYGEEDRHVFLGGKRERGRRSEGRREGGHAETIQGGQP